MPYAEVEPEEVKARIARGEDVFLLDVREPDEVEAWAYPIGVNIPLGQLGDRLDEVPRDATIVVACHVGGRSAAAAKALERRRVDGREPHRRRGGVGGRRRVVNGGRGRVVFDRADDRRCERNPVILRPRRPQCGTRAIQHLI